MWCVENIPFCISWFWHFSMFPFYQIAPDHVVPGPEECYVYSPLGSAYKLQSYTEGYGKNTSLVTMWVKWLFGAWLKLYVNENYWLFFVSIQMFEEANSIFFTAITLCFQFYDLEYHDGNIYTKHSLGHKTGNTNFLAHFLPKWFSLYIASFITEVLMNLHKIHERK